MENSIQCHFYGGLGLAVIKTFKMNIFWRHDKSIFIDYVHGVPKNFRLQEGNSGHLVGPLTQMDKIFPVAFLLLFLLTVKSIYIILGVCVSMCMYASFRNTILKKKLCFTQLRLEGQSSALTFEYTHNFHWCIMSCWFKKFPNLHPNYLYLIIFQNYSNTAN